MILILGISLKQDMTKFSIQLNVSQVFFLYQFIIYHAELIIFSYR